MKAATSLMCMYTCIHTYMHIYTQGRHIHINTYGEFNALWNEKINVCLCKDTVHILLSRNRLMKGWAPKYWWLSPECGTLGDIFFLCYWSILKQVCAFYVIQTKTKLISLWRRRVYTTLNPCIPNSCQRIHTLIACPRNFLNAQSKETELNHNH